MSQIIIINSLFQNPHRSVRMADEPEFIREEILDSEEMRKIFVGGIPCDAQDEELKSFFEGACGGNVTDNQIVRKEGQSEKKELFGFVTFETSELVDEALLQRESLKFKDKELTVNRAVPKNSTWVGARERTKKLFIANLPKNTKEDELMAYLKARHPERYGTIDSIQLIKQKNDEGLKTDVNKGYGFVFVSSEDLADKMAIQHATFEYGGRKIELKKNASGGGEGGRGRGRGGRGGGMRGGGRGGYDGYGAQWGANPYGGYGGYAAYGMDPYAAFGGYPGYGYAGQGNRFQPY